MFDTIKQCVMDYKPRRIPSDDDIRAAVAVLLVERDGGVCTVLTKRTEKVRHHKGEVSFPGGMFEAETGTLNLRRSGNPRRRSG